MSYIAPSVTDLGTVRDLTLQGGGPGGGGSGNAFGKKQIAPDGMSGNDGKGIAGSIAP